MVLEAGHDGSHHLGGDGEADADRAPVGDTIALLMPMTLPLTSKVGLRSCLD
jgi:hypothetical protein